LFSAIMSFGLFKSVAAVVVTTAVVTGLVAVTTADSRADQFVYTTDSDFDLGTLSNVNYDVPDQLQLNEGTTTILPFMWVANAGEDTVSKIDTNTGAEVARYKTWFAPSGGLNAHGAWDGPAPSRTAVDSDGNVYVVNRMFYGHLRPVVIKILATGGIDRNGNGTIETSSDGDSSGTITAAEVLDLTDTNSNGIIDIDDFSDERVAWVAYAGDVGGVGRSLCLAPGGDLWLGNYNTSNYYSLDPSTGATTSGPWGVAGNPYGCVVDSDGILWGASLSSTMVRLDTASPGTATSFTHFDQNYGITTANDKVYLGLITGSRLFAEFDPSTNSFSYPAYPAVQDIAIGVGAASDGDIFASQRWGSGMWRFDPSGTQDWFGASPFTTDTRGAIVDSNGDVWSNHVGANIIRKYDGDTGAFIGAYPVGRHPYTYSDATGIAAASSTNPVGYWTLVKDSGIADAEWDLIEWSSEELDGSSITVEARVSDTEAGLEFETFTAVNSGADPGLIGQFIEVRVRFDAGDDDTSPVLFDLTLNVKTNEAPDCSNIEPSTSELWPPNHKMVPVTFSGASDPDGDDVTLTVLSVFQDEPVDTVGDGKSAPDAEIGNGSVELRAERAGSKKVPGDGRVYHVTITGTDEFGASCEAPTTVTVSVPHDRGKKSVVVDGGPLYDSTTP
jgi:hypothetical protein